MKKKTIKKAGAAVLTMAMLLSMGAVTGISASAATTIRVNPVPVATTSAATENVKVYQVAYRAVDGQWTTNTAFDAYQTRIRALTANTSAQDKNDLANDLKGVVAAGGDNVTKTLVSANGATTGNTAITLTSVDGGADTTKDGYYLVITTKSGSVVQPTLIEIDANGSETITPKANPITITKAITGVTSTKGEISHPNNDSDTSTAIVGAKVSYKLTSQLPTYDWDNGVTANTVKPYIIKDNPSVGLDITNGNAAAAIETAANIKVYVSTDASLATTSDNTEITDLEGVTFAKTTVADDGYADGFKVTLTGAVIKRQNDANKLNIFVTFDATVTEGAVLGADTVTDAGTVYDGTTGNPNRAYLTYGNNFATGAYADPDGKPYEEPDPQDPDIPDEPPVIPSNVVTTYVAKIKLLKVDETDNTSKLNGAVFTLTKQGGTSTDFTTQTINGEDGMIDFGYLEAGTYTLSEKTPPANHKKATQTITFTVKNKEATSEEFSTNEVVTSSVSQKGATDIGTMTVETAGANALFKVQDPPTDTLPATGSIGTVIFTVGGAAIILLAGALFIIYMKKRKAEEE